MCGTEKYTGILLGKKKKNSQKNMDKLKGVRILKVLKSHLKFYVVGTRNFQSISEKEGSFGRKGGRNFLSSGWV